MKTLLRIAVVTVLVVASPLVQAEPHYCGPLKQSGLYGPFDYTNPTHRAEKLPIVEINHFTDNVRNLIKGESAVLGEDISYTLKAFPNHHKALIAISKLSIRENDVRPIEAEYSVECFFDRAIRFKPSDGVVRMLYANYLLKLKGRAEDALEQYQEAVNVAPFNANINYNLGLLYLKKKNYEQAVVYAKKAYGLGFPLPGLKNKLKRKGKWDGTLDERPDEKKEESTDQNLQG